MSRGNKRSALRNKVGHIIFEADTPAAKLFDVVLILSIILSVLAVMMISMEEVRKNWGSYLTGVEWFFTILFSIEYFARLWSSHAPWRYARSFYGVVDLISIIPTYLSLFLPGAEYLIVIRSLRTLRVFRILKLLQYVTGGNVIMRALVSSRYKITVFLMCVMVLVTIIGAAMYLIEGAESGFSSIPTSIYWAIVTLTTVGYGDLSPATPLGQFMASIVMLTGYAIIAVPTGIVTAELSRAQYGPGQHSDHPISEKRPECPECGQTDHKSGSNFCHQCGTPLIHRHI